MPVIAWIIGSGILMSLIAFAGAFSLFIPHPVLKKITIPLVSLSAGTLIGSALFHLMPEGLGQFENTEDFFILVFIGFSAFFAIEQFVHWHKGTHSTASGKQPVTYLILLGDALHNFIGGLTIAAAFITDIRLGIMTWLAAAAHEIPQELGDFGVLIHGGWDKRKALLLNFLCALPFPAGGLITWIAAYNLDVAFLIPIAAGNFLYLAASDLVPEVHKHLHVHDGGHKYAAAGETAVNFACFLAGAGILLIIRMAFG